MEIKQEPVDVYENEEKIKRIIEKEFEREISEREEEVIRIEERIQQVKRFIHIVKYSASHNLYQKEKLEDMDVEPGIHPCVKKLLEKQSAVPKNEEVVEDVPVVTEVEAKIEENVMVVRGTYRVRHHIIIGNISKWQGAREDGATHKWMIYVRDKSDENLSKFVKKVRYFLHESYKPHDIIDVTSWPFHLTRRGWGEFPVRVTIFFKHSANKPVDFVHQLRLDQTCSGVDQLGGETVFELDLIHEDLNIPVEENAPVEICSQMDHDYCRTEFSENVTESPAVLKQLSSQALSLGAETSEIDALQNWSYEKDGPIVAWYKNDVINRLAGITFFSAEACVKWFLKRWPMISLHALVPRYKNVHAYCFPSLEDFSKASDARRFAAEWYRSYKIKIMLESLNLKVWTTREILLYARMHGYVSVLTKQFFSSENLPKFSTYSSDIDREHDMRQLETIDCPEIDIIGEEITKPETTVLSSQPMKFLSNWSQTVEIFSKQIGIRLGDEEIDSFCAANVSSVILGHVLKSFLDDLLRKSMCNAWLRNNNRNPGTLEAADIVKSIIECPEFDILTNVGLGSKN